MPIINTNVASTTTITQSGTYDVAPYTSAIVDIPTTPPIFNVSVSQFLGTVDGSGVYQKPTTAGTLDLTGVVKITGNMFARFAYTSITSVSAPDLVEINNIQDSNGFSGCSFLFAGSNVESVSFPALKKMTGAGMAGWFRSTPLTSLSLPELEEADSIAEICYTSRNITSIDLPKLKKVNSSASNFASYTRSPTINFGALDTLGQYVNFGYCFQGSTPTIYFRALKASSFVNTGIFNNMFQYAYPNPVLHFPTNLDPSNPNKTFDLSTLTGYPNFGGSNVTLLFDLPATE